jgi:hypothetical protein
MAPTTGNGACLTGVPGCDRPQSSSCFSMSMGKRSEHQNALAETCWQQCVRTAVSLLIGVEPYAADIRLGENVVVVGAFVPFLTALKRADQHFTVLEMDPAALNRDEMLYFRSAHEASGRAGGACGADHRHHASERHLGRIAGAMPSRDSGGHGRPDAATHPSV